MARETINGISVPIPGTGEPADFVGDLRRIATDLSASYVSTIAARGAGIDPTGVADSTAGIQARITAAAGRVLFIPAGTYKLSRTGTRTNPFDSTTKGYALLLDGHDGTQVICDAGAEFVIPTSDGSDATAILVDNSTNVTVVNARGTGSSDAYTKTPYTRSVVVVQNSSHVRVLGAVAHGQLMHAVGAFSCSDVLIRDGLAHAEGHALSGSSFGLYACSESTIENCTTYGGTGDGDITVYGLPSLNNSVRGCRAYSYVFGDATKTPTNNALQGICVDSGADGTIVSGNHVEGYFYGIDVKTDVMHTVVTGNTVVGCKVGITARQGEGDQPTNTTKITDNVIAPNGGTGNTTAFAGYTIPIGVMLSGDVYGAEVVNNTIGNTILDSGNANPSFLGVLAVLSVATEGEAYVAPLAIRGNRFATEPRIAAETNYSTETTLIHVEGNNGGGTTPGQSAVVIADNLLDTHLSSVDTSALVIVRRVYGVAIHGNVGGVLKGGAVFDIADCYFATLAGNSIVEPIGGFLKAERVYALTVNANTFGPPSAFAAYLQALSCSEVAVTGNTARAYGGAQDGVFLVGTGTSNVLVVANVASLATYSSADWLFDLPGDAVVANNIVV